MKFSVVDYFSSHYKWKHTRKCYKYFWAIHKDKLKDIYFPSVLVVTCCYWPARRCRDWPIQTRHFRQFIVTYGHARALRVVGNPWDEVMCSSTTNAIGAGNTDFVECFEAAQSFGFYNFQTFLWSSHRKWPREPWKVTNFLLPRFVSKHAVRLRWEGKTQRNIAPCKTRNFTLRARKTVSFTTVLLIIRFIFFLTVSRKLSPPEQDGKTVSTFAFLRSNASINGWAGYCCSLQLEALCLASCFLVCLLYMATFESTISSHVFTSLVF